MPVGDAWGDLVHRAICVDALGNLYGGGDMEPNETYDFGNGVTANSPFGGLVVVKYSR